MEPVGWRVETGQPPVERDSGGWFPLCIVPRSTSERRQVAACVGITALGGVWVCVRALLYTCACLLYGLVEPYNNVTEYNSYYTHYYRRLQTAARGILKPSTGGGGADNSGVDPPSMRNLAKDARENATCALSTAYDPRSL